MCYLTVLIDFVPNDDVAQARKFRIRKAMERGAMWARSWTDDITHVIVDDDRSYSDVLRFLQIPSLPVRITYPTSPSPFIAEVVSIAPCHSGQRDLPSRMLRCPRAPQSYSRTIQRQRPSGISSHTSVFDTPNIVRRLSGPEARKASIFADSFSYRR